MKVSPILHTTDTTYPDTTYTECGIRSFPRFCQKFSWQFRRPVGHTTAVVQPGKKKIAVGTSLKNKQNLQKQPNAAGCSY